jgi:hypothetical protein
MKEKIDSAIHHRRSIRLKGYDYTRPGAYYMTICLQDKSNQWEMSPARLMGQIMGIHHQHPIGTDAHDCIDKKEWDYRNG